MSKRPKAISGNSRPASVPTGDIAHSVGSLLERNPREAAVIQSFVERKLKGLVLPKKEAEQAAFVAKTNHSIFIAVMKSEECKRAAKKMLREFEGAPIIKADPRGQRPQQRELFWWIVGIIVVVAVTGCVKDKPHQTTTTGGGVMKPGTNQNDPVNQGSTDGGTDGSDSD